MPIQIYQPIYHSKESAIHCHLNIKNDWFPERSPYPLPFSGTFEADDVIGFPNLSASLEGCDAKTAKSLNVF